MFGKNTKKILKLLTPQLNNLQSLKKLFKDIKKFNLSFKNR
jgi:hypothetical protein